MEYRMNLLRKREELNQMKSELQSQADKENDEFRVSTKQTLSKYADILEDVFANIETIVTGQSALKLQIDTLKNAIFVLPEVKNNSNLQKEIESLIRKYNSSM